jgi:hypothetical protein
VLCAVIFDFIGRHRRRRRRFTEPAIEKGGYGITRHFFLLLLLSRCEVAKNPSARDIIQASKNRHRRAASSIIEPYYRYIMPYLLPVQYVPLLVSHVPFVPPYPLPSIEESKIPSHLIHVGASRSLIHAYIDTDINTVSSRRARSSARLEDVDDDSIPSSFSVVAEAASSKVGLWW